MQREKEKAAAKKEEVRPKSAPKLNIDGTYATQSASTEAVKHISVQTSVSKPTIPPLRRKKTKSRKKSKKIKKKYLIFAKFPKFSFSSKQQSSFSAVISSWLRFCRQLWRNLLWNLGRTNNSIRSQRISSLQMSFTFSRICCDWGKLKSPQPQWTQVWDPQNILKPR